MNSSGLSENIRMAFTSLFSNKLRAILTTLGIGIGIASVVALVSLGQSVQIYVADQFSSAGSNLVFILPAVAFNQSGTGARASNTSAFSSLTEKDLAMMRNTAVLPDVEVGIPLVELFRDVTYGGASVRVQVSAVTSPYFNMTNRKIGQGRFFDDQDDLASSRVAVIGQTVVDDLFPPDTSALDQTIRISGVDFKVIGILAPAGTGIGGNQDNVIDIPITTAESHLQTAKNPSGEKLLNGILLKAISDATVGPLAESAKQLLRTAHKIKPTNDDDFTVITQKDMIERFGAITSLLTVFLGVIAGISLLVGGIGVMNIMLVTVTERTREIGLRKAVGARGTDVLFQFLTEAVILCFVGCIAGLAVAELLMLVLGKALPTLNPYISLQSVLMATTVTTLIGIFFGLYPASRAASLSPINALRFE